MPRSVARKERRRSSNSLRVRSVRSSWPRDLRSSITHLTRGLDGIFVFGDSQRVPWLPLHRRASGWRLRGIGGGAPDRRIWSDPPGSHRRPPPRWPPGIDTRPSKVPWCSGMKDWIRRGSRYLRARSNPSLTCARNHAGARIGLHLFMDVLARNLVLDEVLGPDGLACVMIQGPDTRQHGVGADGSRGLFRQIGHLQAVLVGPWAPGAECTEAKDDRAGRARAASGWWRCPASCRRAARDQRRCWRRAGR